MLASWNTNSNGSHVEAKTIYFDFDLYLLLNKHVLIGLVIHYSNFIFVATMSKLFSAKVLVICVRCVNIKLAGDKNVSAKPHLSGCAPS